MNYLFNIISYRHNGDIPYFFRGNKENLFQTMLKK